MRADLIPQKIKEELIQCARSESDALWLIADRALEILENYRSKQDKGLWLDVSEWDVYSAIGVLCDKSPSRVKQLAWVAQQTLVELREGYQDEWGFGYFERIASRLELDPYEVFEFLTEYRDGTLTYPQPGRVLGVGEFLLMYDTHIHGKNRDDVPPSPEVQGFDLSQAFTEQLSFQGIISQARYLKRKLAAYLDRPNARRVYELAEELETTIPQAMEELGYTFGTKKVVDKQDVM